MSFRFDVLKNRQKNIQNAEKNYKSYKLITLNSYSLSFNQIIIKPDKKKYLHQLNTVQSPIQDLSILRLPRLVR